MDHVRTIKKTYNFAGNSNLERVYNPNSNASLRTEAFPNNHVLAGVTAYCSSEQVISIFLILSCPK